MSNNSSLCLFYCWHLNNQKEKHYLNKEKTPWRGIEPRSSAWQAEILATILPRNPLEFLTKLYYFLPLYFHQLSFCKQNYQQQINCTHMDAHRHTQRSPSWLYESDLLGLPSWTDSVLPSSAKDTRIASHSSIPSAALFDVILHKSVRAGRSM